MSLINEVKMRDVVVVEGGQTITADNMHVNGNTAKTMAAEKGELCCNSVRQQRDVLLEAGNKSSEALTISAGQSQVAANTMRIGGREVGRAGGMSVVVFVETQCFCFGETVELSSGSNLRNCDKEEINLILELVLFTVKKRKVTTLISVCLYNLVGKCLYKS